MPELIFFGDSVKALDDAGKVGGYLVRFSDSSHKDLAGEWFDDKTYLGAREGDGVDTTFHHGQPIPVKAALSPALKAQIKNLSEHFFAPIKTTRDAIGIWAETVLDMADEYEAAVFGFVKDGKIGWSSGAVGHLVKVNQDGYIKTWPIGEAALTPCPCEPQNRAVPVKSLLELAFKGFEAPEPEKTLKGMLAQEMADDGPSFWQVECSMHELIGDIAEAASANQEILASPINVDQKLTDLFSEFVSLAKPIAAQQIADYLAGDQEWDFYLKGMVAVPDFAQAVAAMTERVNGLQRNHENRTKEGRMLSAANRKKLSTFKESMTGLVTMVDDLLAASEPKPKSANPVELSRLRFELLKGAA